MVCTGSKTDGGRFVVVVPNGVNTKDDCGLETIELMLDNRIFDFFEFGMAYRFVVKCPDSSSSSIGQQTPGMNKRLKHNESRSPDRLSSSPGQTLKSSHRPGVPNGVIQRFSPSFPSISLI